MFLRCIKYYSIRTTGLQVKCVFDVHSLRNDNLFHAAAVSFDYCVHKKQFVNFFFFCETAVLRPRKIFEFFFYFFECELYENMAGHPRKHIRICGTSRFGFYQNIWRWPCTGVYSGIAAPEIDVWTWQTSGNRMFSDFVICFRPM